MSDAAPNGGNGSASDADQNVLRLQSCSFANGACMAAAVSCTEKFTKVMLKMRFCKCRPTLTRIGANELALGADQNEPSNSAVAAKLRPGRAGEVLVLRHYWRFSRQ